MMEIVAVVAPFCVVAIGCSLCDEGTREAPAHEARSAPWQELGIPNKAAYCERDLRPPVDGEPLPPGVDDYVVLPDTPDKEAAAALLEPLVTTQGWKRRPNTKELDEHEFQSALRGTQIEGVCPEQFLLFADERNRRLLFRLTMCGKRTRAYARTWDCNEWPEGDDCRQ